MQVVYFSIPDETSYISKSQACIKYLHVGTLKIHLDKDFFCSDLDLCICYILSYSWIFSYPVVYFPLQSKREFIETSNFYDSCFSPTVYLFTGIVSGKVLN